MSLTLLRVCTLIFGMKSLVYEAWALNTFDWQHLTGKYLTSMKNNDSLMIQATMLYRYLFKYQTELQGRLI